MVDSSPRNWESKWSNVVRELVETERNYVRQLEVQSEYASILSVRNASLTQQLFPDIAKVAQFQQDLSTRFDATFLSLPREQDWGRHFVETEIDFKTLYEPYTKSYVLAPEILAEHEGTLTDFKLNDLIDAKYELMSVISRPISRICKYPLLLNCLMKTAPSDHPHLKSLKSGLEASQRVAEAINDALRRDENTLIARQLRLRVVDWKGLDAEDLGRLLLSDVFLVSRMEVDREYHVYVFEKVILCCQEARRSGHGGKILSSVGFSQRKKSPLLLKGRVFLSGVTEVVSLPQTTGSSSAAPRASQWPLKIFWETRTSERSSFTFHCRTEEKTQRWKSTISGLVDLNTRVSDERSCV